MKLMVFGITHKNSSIALRERVAFSKSRLSQAYEFFRTSEFVEESIIISTCNRSEIFAVVQDITEAEEWFRLFYQAFFKLEAKTLEGSYSYRDGADAVAYLFEVCCGLDSLVLGEDQILGQVKEAHSRAMAEKACGKILNRLFQEAVSAAKEIKTNTGISENSLSISAIAVKQIEEELQQLQNKAIMVIGFGKMSRLAIENLLDKGVREIYICNRSRESVEDLLKQHSRLRYITFDEKYRCINEVDAIISATGAPHYVLHYQEFKEALKPRSEGQRLCLVDIALPRDIDPHIGDIEGIGLYHIDQLKKIADENLSFREKCIDDIKACIKEKVADYVGWYQCLPLHPRIEAIQDYSRNLTDQELEKLFARLQHMAEKDKQVVEVVVRSLMKKMWKRPILQMKKAGNDGRGEEIASFVDELFGFENKLRK